MATVYFAEDVRHHRKVAVKVLRPELAVALRAERFLHETEVAAQLNHPHILALHIPARSTIPVAVRGDEVTDLGSAIGKFTQVVTP